MELNEEIRKKLWMAVMEKGKKLERGVTHELSDDEVITILATIDFFQPNENFLKQAVFDLRVAKYEIYDWVAMLLFGRDQGYGEHDFERERQEYITKIMTSAYLRAKDLKDFIRILRTEDYQVIEPKIPVL